MEILKKLYWRYATKDFNRNKKLTSEQLNTLLEAANLAPSSFGLQPFQIIVVENQEIRERLKEVCYQQPQVTSASQVIIFAIKNNLSDHHVDEFVNRIADKWEKSPQDLNAYADAIKGKINRLSAENKINWAAKQSYIALGFLLYTAAQMNIDACPMEGFEPEKVDEVLGLKEKNLSSKVMATVGFRSENDKYQYNPKVRFPIDQMVIKI